MRLYICCTKYVLYGVGNNVFADFVVVFCVTQGLLSLASVVCVGSGSTTSSCVVVVASYGSSAAKNVLSPEDRSSFTAHALLPFAVTPLLLGYDSTVLR